jgi:hypothetical protein
MVGTIVSGKKEFFLLVGYASFREAFLCGGVSKDKSQVC